MQSLLTLLLSSLLAAGLLSCSNEAPHDHDHDGDHGHEHPADDDKGDDHGDSHADEQADEHDHEHEEVSIGSTTVGEWTVKLAQGHGPVTAGEEGHLVVVLPFKDDGATTVRAWIGSADRNASFVGKGDYAPSHDDYDVHATAPDPLPQDVKWWIEIERPDGKKATGSAQPNL
jgi:hypothetical protein